MRSVTSFVMTVSFTLGSGFVFAVPPTQPAPETVDFLTAHAGAKAALSEDGIGAIFGVPLAEKPEEQATEPFVKQFLDDNPGILGVPTLDLEYDNELVIANGKFTVFTYAQEVAEEDDLPMHGGFIKVLVLMGATEKIVHIGAALKYEPESTLPDDEEPLEDALITASAAYPQLTNWSTPEKVVYRATDNSYHRAWRFRGWSDSEAYMFLVPFVTATY